MFDEIEIDIDDLECCMKGVMEFLCYEFVLLCMGCVLVSMVELIMVDVYGLFMLINQIGMVNVFELWLVMINVWDKVLVVKVEKVICDLGLGINLQLNGIIIMLLILELNEECCRDLICVVV